MKLEVLKKESIGSPKGMLLFIHGMGHGAWCWKNFMGYFSENGYSCVALSLRGHGKSEGREDLDRYSLDDYVEDVHRTVSELGVKPIVIGHSMGGYVVQKYIELYEDNVQAAVLFSSVPVSGMTLGSDVRFFWRFLASAIRTMPKIVDEELSLEEISKFVYCNGRIPADEIREYVSLLQPESKRAVLELQIPRFVTHDITIPMYILGSNSDMVFPGREQTKTGRAYHVDPVMLRDLCHDMMLDPEWRVAAAHLRGFFETISD
ncbi:MAG: alpha/beta hydrolase [Actinobacteria bacterium]|nr:alpha/beta hydrolase [Actinomycetota bacterium]